MDAKVEAFGRNFSGGQRQRLTIARALVRKAPFLILDDSTSALDYLTEAKLLSAIHEELKEVTLVLISQRTNSLKAADKILLLDRGHQLGFASHDELLKQMMFTALFITHNTKKKRRRKMKAKIKIILAAVCSKIFYHKKDLFLVPHLERLRKSL